MLYKEVYDVMQHRNKCRCPHHVIQKILMVLAAIAGLGFLITLYRKGVPLVDHGFFSMGPVEYFMQFIVFALASFGMSIGVCSCCCDRKMMCEECMIQKDDTEMEMKKM